MTWSSSARSGRPGERDGLDVRRRAVDLVDVDLRTALLVAPLHDLAVMDLVVEHQDAVHERLGPRGAARHVDVDGHDLVDALHERVVVEHPAGARAHTSR